MSEEEFIEELSRSDRAVTSWDWEEFWATEEFIEDVEDEEDE